MCARCNLCASIYKYLKSYTLVDRAFIKSILTIYNHYNIKKNKINNKKTLYKLTIIFTIYFLNNMQINHHLNNLPRNNQAEQHLELYKLHKYPIYLDMQYTQSNHRNLQHKKSLVLTFPQPRLFFRPILTPHYVSWNNPMKSMQQLL